MEVASKGLTRHDLGTGVCQSSWQHRTVLWTGQRRIAVRERLPCISWPSKDRAELVQYYTGHPFSLRSASCILVSIKWVYTPACKFCGARYCVCYLAFKLRCHPRCYRRVVFIKSQRWLFDRVVHRGLCMRAAGVCDTKWNVEGWRVVLKDTGEVLGCVEEVMAIGCNGVGTSSIYEHVLKVVDTSSMPATEFQVPWVEEFVKEVDNSSQSLVITPPEGLLELARRPEALRKLRPALLEFGMITPGGIGSSLKKTQATVNLRGVASGAQQAGSPDLLSTAQEQAESYMPTRRQLLAARRPDLVEMIMAAGGFLSVAHALGLRARRRPVGFWEDLQNLDAELEKFVGGSWTMQTNPETGGVTYLNLVTHEVLLNEPARTSVMDPGPVSQFVGDSGTAVMPRQRTVKEAGRYDLHHAIMMHGGYKEVARQLGRETVSRSSLSKLEIDIVTFMQEHGLSLFPTVTELRAQNRTDLIMAIRKYGGIGAMADHMGLRAQRCGKRHWAGVEEAAGALRAYLLQKLIEDKGIDSMEDAADTLWAEAVRSGSVRWPTQSELLADGRKDLCNVLQKFGRQALANHLNIELNLRRSQPDGLIGWT